MVVLGAFESVVHTSSCPRPLETGPVDASFHRSWCTGQFLRGQLGSASFQSLCLAWILNLPTFSQIHPTLLGHSPVPAQQGWGFHNELLPMLGSGWRESPIPKPISFPTLLVQDKHVMCALGNLKEIPEIERLSTGSKIESSTGMSFCLSALFLGLPQREDSIQRLPPVTS